MKQLLQDVASGNIEVVDVPPPTRGAASLLVATRCSVISPGTERAVVELGRKSLVGKASARPEAARAVLGTAREEGLRSAYHKVRGRLEQPNPLGYSSCGVVLEAPDDAPAGPGELVACAGTGWASHAEIVAVPRTLCARVPDGVAPEDAAYTTLGAVALHGVRLCEVQIGDVVAVIGLGLIGQLMLQILAASGCVALGLDPDAERVRIAQEAGFFATAKPAELESESLRRTARRGADAALIAAATSGPEPLEAAIASARDRASVCIVGDVPVTASRNALYAKELRLVVSRSYGPGRYDPSYEERGADYPAAYVRWTAGRNLHAVLRLIETGALHPSRLTTHTFAIDKGTAAYALLDSGEPSLGVLLQYDESPETLRRTIDVRPAHRPRIRRPSRARPRVGVIGAGTFARTVLLPSLARHADIGAVVTATGPSARATAARFGAGRAGTDPSMVFEDEQLDAVLIATRHDTHAEYAARALESGKHVFVEKPPALDEDGLAMLETAANHPSAGTLTVGFNRRFAPLAVRLRAALANRGPVVIHYRVSAGRLAAEHWIRDPRIGGGRIVGEVCHFVDFVTFLSGQPPADVNARALEGSSEPRDDTVAATLYFPDGSLATLIYAAIGDRALPKEHVEVLGEAGAGVLDDFRQLTLYRNGRKRAKRGRRDKGHAAEMKAFVEACRTGLPAQELDEVLGVMRSTFSIRDSVKRRPSAQD